MPGFLFIVAWGLFSKKTPPMMRILMSLIGGVFYLGQTGLLLLGEDVDADIVEGQSGGGGGQGA